VLAFILDSLGSTELLFILVIALIFFGPRKLPQLSRSLGKSIAEFRKASEDFKRTWEREVALESAREQTPGFSEIPEPSVEPIPAEHVMARNSQPEQPQESNEVTEFPIEPANPEPLTKREWL
jgi:TatA/E family protein of Tat protein translocase